MRIKPFQLKMRLKLALLQEKGWMCIQSTFLRRFNLHSAVPYERGRGLNAKAIQNEINGVTLRQICCKSYIKNVSNRKITRISLKRSNTHRPTNVGPKNQQFNSIYTLIQYGSEKKSPSRDSGCVWENVIWACRLCGSRHRQKQSWKKKPYTHRMSQPIFSFSLSLPLHAHTIHFICDEFRLFFYFVWWGSFETVFLSGDLLAQ